MAPLWSEYGVGDVPRPFWFSGEIGDSPKSFCADGRSEGVGDTVLI
jgi:hypothetical protein